MRLAPFVFALALSVPWVPLAQPQASQTQIHLSLPVLFEYVYPGAPERIDGELTVTFPDNATCSTDVAYTIEVDEAPEYVDVSIDPASGALPFQSGSTSRVGVIVQLASTDAAIAYDRIDVVLRAATGACGTLEAHEVFAQTGARVGFHPELVLALMPSPSEISWNISITNLGNAASRFDWRLIQPSLGRVLAGGPQLLPGPEGGLDDPVTFLHASKAGFDPTADVVINGSVSYQGEYPVTGPPVGYADLLVHDAPDPPPWWQENLRWMLMVAALGVLAGAALVALGRWVKKRRV